MPEVSTEDLSAGEHPVLFDREDDLAALDRALAEACSGAGGVLLIEGPAGIGKTVLLDELRRRASGLSMTVLAARGGELERGFGFGVVRQLLETVLVAADTAERDRLLAGAARLAQSVFTDVPTAEKTGDIAFATLHGLYWLVVNLTERGPLVLAVDDAQWADEPSIRFFLHLAHRLAGLPVVLALTVRSEADRHRDDLSSLMLEARPPVLRPRPLGDSAVTRLVRASLGTGADAQLCSACAHATGGNPFLLSELLGEFRREGRPASDIDAAVVDRLAPERIATAVLLRVGRLHPQATALARAVAVLGEQARLAFCAQLADIEPRIAPTLAARLVDLTVLVSGDPLRFVHPIVRTAIYEDLTAAERAGLHARAARLLADHHADRGAIGVHLLATPPSGERQVVAMLREAARSALAGGAPDTAAALLRRALDEPPDATDRPQVLFELGNAEHEIGDPAAKGHLAEAGASTADPLTRARAFTALAWTTHTDVLRQREQLPHYERAAAEVAPRDRELALQLEAARLGALMVNPDLPVKFEAEAARFRDQPVITAAECLLRSFVARSALETGPVSVAGDLAEQAGSHPALVSQGGHPLWRTNVTICLVEAERYEVAEHILTRAIRHAERSGSPQWLSRALWLRGLARHRRGDLRSAEADARSSVDLHGPSADYRAAPGLVVVIESLADQGRVDEGDALLAARGMDGELAPILFSVLPLLSRGRLRAAAGDHERARKDLMDALLRIEESRGMFPWANDAQVALVPVLLALGDDRAAHTVAEQALAAAETAGSFRRLGGALRVCGLVTGGEEGLDLLRRAADTLARSPAVLWRAQAYIDLGTALRHAGHAVAARTALRDGMELAHRCGAISLADRAEAELRAAGGRPRRRAGTGADALTPSERRVAELAAHGVSNKEIAQSLFVTLRTVELHLSNAYSKLEIRSRHQLAAALGG
ncbi:ATP-binding protein [Mycolicibacterium wolinskyi]|uniref:ATP-binding protein n=1 Tax=Mycolicibacterium wolinskyi TaxID=59750 RepID=UPI0039178449